MINFDPRSGDGRAVCAICAWPRSTLRDPCCDGLDDEERSQTWSLQGHNDLCAAVRTAALVPQRRRAATIDRLLKRCRDVSELSSEALADEIKRATHAVHNCDRRDRVAGRPEGVVAMALSRMVAGEFQKLVLVELGPNGISSQEITLSSDYSLHACARLERQDIWAEFVGEPPGSEYRNFFLAGGVVHEKQPPRHRDPVQLRQLAERYLSECGLCPPNPDSEYLIIRRVTGWLVIDLLVAAMRSCVLPTGQIILRPSAPLLAQLADDWCAIAPLRHGYELAVAEIGHPDGVVSISTVVLFGAGTTAEPSGAIRVPIKLTRADGQSGALTLPVLIASAKPVHARDQLVVGRAELPDSGPVSCELVLRRPGEVEFGPLRSGSSQMTLPVTVSNTPSWSDIVNNIPSHNAFEVVIALEFSGIPEVVKPRIDIARNLLHALHIRDDLVPGSVRVAAIRYIDHPEKPPRRRKKACQVEPFIAPSAMIDALVQCLIIDFLLPEVRLVPGQL